MKEEVLFAKFFLSVAAASEDRWLLVFCCCERRWCLRGILLNEGLCVETMRRVYLLLFKTTRAVELMIVVTRRANCTVKPLASLLMIMLATARIMKFALHDLIRDLLCVLEYLLYRLPLLDQVAIEVLAEVVSDGVHYGVVLVHTHYERYASFSEHIVHDCRVTRVHEHQLSTAGN